MLKNGYKLIFTLFFLVTFANLLAQNDELGDSGEIEDVQVEIVKNREIILPRANRNYDKVPPISIESSNKELTYDFRSFSFEVPELEFRLRPLRLKNEALSKLYGGYIKAGFGNYLTPYFEGLISNKRDKQYSYGAHVRHLSSGNGPVDSENSGNSQTNFRVNGDMHGKNAVVGGSLGYKGLKYNYYGYATGLNVDKDTIGHNFNSISAEAHIRSSKANSSFHYNSSVRVDHIKDNYEAKESEIGLSLFGKYDITQESNISLDFDLRVANQSDLSFSSHSRLLTSVVPQYNFKYNNIDISAGLNLTYTDDSLGNLTSFRLYPLVRAKYNIAPKTNLFASLSGNTRRNTYRQLSSENPYLGQNSIAYDNNVLLDFYGGIESSISDKFFAEARVGYKAVKNMHYFTNSLKQEEFNVIYDTGTTSITSLLTKLKFIANSSFSLGFVGELNQYSTDLVAEPWHRPQFRIGLNSQYNVYDKVLFTMDLFVLGGIKAQNSITGSSLTLDPVVDLGFGVEYRFSDRFSTFIKLKNILSNEYEYFQYYPVKGLQVLAGLTYSF